MAYPQTSTSATLTNAYAGMLVSSEPHTIRSYVNGESSAEIPFGVMVGQGTLTNEAINLAAITDKLVGIVVHSHAYAKTDELGTTGLKAGVVMNVLAKGTIWVLTEETVTPASPVYVRAVVAGVEVAGAFRDSADASDLIDISHIARYLTGCTGAGLVQLSIDVDMRGADVAD
jgi:hypothetical protein